MSSDYAKQLAKSAVGKILLTLGWHSIQTTPLEVLTEIFTSYILQMGHMSSEYANQCKALHLSFGGRLKALSFS